MAKKTTHLKEIAYELGLSVNTISRALRDCYDISAETKKLVVDKAIEMGYLPNSVSQFIKTGNKRLVAFVVNDLKNYYFLNVCDKFVKALKKINSSFTMIYTDKQYVDADVFKQCISQRADAIVCFCRPDTEIIKLASLNQIPLVFLGQSEDDTNLSCIYADNERGGKIAANYLLNFHNANKMIYYGLTGYYDSDIRYKSFSTTIKNNSTSSEIVYLDNSTSGSELANYVQDGYLNIFCFCDEFAYDLLDKLNSEIPNVRKIYPKLHIIGFDCLSKKSVGLIDITSIDFSIDSVVSETLKIIKNFNEGNKNPVRVSIPVSLHIRSIF